MSKIDNQIWKNLRNKYRSNLEAILIIDSLENIFEENQNRFPTTFCIPDFDQALLPKLFNELGHTISIKRWNVGRKLYSLVIRIEN